MEGVPNYNSAFATNGIFDIDNIVTGVLVHKRPTYMCQMGEHFRNNRDCEICDILVDLRDNGSGHWWSFRKDTVTNK